MDYKAYINSLLAQMPAQITTLEQIRALPWQGNAAGDVPIMQYVDRNFGLNEALPRELRKTGIALAGNLMTGENCDFASDAEFDEYLQEAREANQ